LNFIIKTNNKEKEKKSINFARSQQDENSNYGDDLFETPIRNDMSHNRFATISKVDGIFQSPFCKNSTNIDMQEEVKIEYWNTSKSNAKTLASTSGFREHINDKASRCAKPPTGNTSDPQINMWVKRGSKRMKEWRESNNADSVTIISDDESIIEADAIKKKQKAKMWSFL